MFQDAVLLARLVEAEIMSPYYGILINTGVGNPTVPRVGFLGNMQVSKSTRGTLDIRSLYKGTKACLFFHT